VQQLLAADPAEAMARRYLARAPEPDGNVIPVGKVICGISAALSGSLTARLSSVSSDSTTPQPNVSSGLLRSKTVMS
jgi:hypothetical protein